MNDNTKAVLGIAALIGAALFLNRKPFFKGFSGLGNDIDDLDAWREEMLDKINASRKDGVPFEVRSVQAAKVEEAWLRQMKDITAKKAAGAKEDWKKIRQEIMDSWSKQK